ncbi:DUF692 domain-containing protein [Arsukibacterium sp.]|uniref:DUF692 domain-containing protein n=1 Tax=Arsukibacterium sp. TaxID=1977258 RepID=UPI002FDA0029
MADFDANALPTSVLSTGVSFKLQHYPDVLTDKVQGMWYEVHTENFCGVGGARLAALQALAERYPLSFHGVGASLAGPEPINTQHLQWVASLVKHIKPTLVSEHAVWSGLKQAYFADLLPFPRTRSVLQQLIRGVQQYQEAIGRAILVENPTHYLGFNHDMHEPDFMVELTQRTGCGLLLDITNLYLSQNNSGVNARQYIDQIPVKLVGELHIAGFSADPIEGDNLLIDSHDHAPNQAVLELLAYALKRFGARPVLLEWDDRVPALAELLQQRMHVQAVLSPFMERVNAKG